MYCMRVVVLVLLQVFTAAGVCSCLFPLFRLAMDDGVKSTLYYWYWEMTIPTPSKSTVTIFREYSRNFVCDPVKTYLIICSATSTAGAVFGAISTLLSAALVAKKKSAALCIAVAFTCFLAFACFAACVALTTLIYARPQCQGAPGQIDLKEDGYAIVEGFGLMCASCGGFFLTFLLGLWSC